MVNDGLDLFQWNFPLYCFEKCSLPNKKRIEWQPTIPSSSSFPGYWPRNQEDDDKKRKKPLPNWPIIRSEKKNPKYIVTHPVIEERETPRKFKKCSVLSQIKSHVKNKSRTVKEKE